MQENPTTASKLQHKRVRKPQPIIGTAACEQAHGEVEATVHVTIDEIILIFKKFRKPRTMLMAFIMHAYRKENLSVKGLCERFDSRGVPVPNSVAESYKEWLAFYKHEGTACCKEIDKVAKRLKALHLP